MSKDAEVFQIICFVPLLLHFPYNGRGNEDVSDLPGPSAFFMKDSWQPEPLLSLTLLSWACMPHPE